MFVVSSLLWPRLFTPSRLRFTLYRRRTGGFVSVQRFSPSKASNSSVDFNNSALERYKDLQKYFYRRLKATYYRFSDTRDDSVVCGHRHVYFVEGDGIYRMDAKQSEREPEQVLNLGQVSGGDEKTVVENEESKQRVQWTIQRIRVSPQEKHLAATLKLNHREELRCVVVRLGRNHLPPWEFSHIVVLLDSVFSFEWATDDVLFYTTMENLRCSNVFRLDLASHTHRITSVYQETRPDVFVEVAVSRDQQILSINCNSRTSSEVLLIDKATSHSEPRLVQSRQPDLLYHVEHWKRRLIILASTGPGQEYEVVQAPLPQPNMGSWEPLFAPSRGTAVTDMDVVGDHCVLIARTPANELVLTIVPLTHPEETCTLNFPSWACAIKTSKPGLEDRQKVLKFLISSPVHPPVPYCLYAEDGLLLPEDGPFLEIHGDYNTTRLEACSKDGTLVPVTLLHAKPVESLRQVPLLVHVYGAYGRELDMEFCPVKRFLLEQGWALAYCHVRGGGERGLYWQRQARAEGKPKTVEDLGACLRHLFSSGVSCPALTALTACSAGAVPVGALCNMHPQMIRAVTLQAPFLDVLGTMKDPSLPLSLEDREEWGDPVGNPEHRLVISSYCPLHNIRPQNYPSMLLTASSDDARAPLAGVLRYTERLQKAAATHFTTSLESEQAANIVLNIQPGANHFGPDDFRGMLEEEALKLAFLYTELGLEPPRPPRRRRR